MAVGLVSDITKALKDEQIKQAGVKKWEDIILNPYKALAEAESEAVSTRTKYDISDAYANYKKSELNVMRNQRLGSGFKRQIAADLKSEYEKQYEAEKLEEASNIYDITSKYETAAQKEIQSQEKQITDYASKLKKLEDYVYKFAGVDPTKANMAIGSGGLGFYSPVKGSVGEFEITDIGKDFFDKTLHSANTEGQLFSTYLLENDNDLYDFYAQNKGAFNKYIAGLDVLDYDYTDKRTRWYGNPELIRNYFEQNYDLSELYANENKNATKYRQAATEEFVEIAKDLGVSKKYTKEYISNKIAPKGTITKDGNIRHIKQTEQELSYEELIDEMIKESAKIKHK
jgi:hypothetical protein